MKEIKNVTIYKCDFCKKELKRKHSMANHEIKCHNNPENNRKCFNGCAYLERKTIELYTGIDEYNTGEPVNKKYNGFYCSAKKQYLIPPIIEHKDGKNTNAKFGYDDKGEEVEQEFMPKECDLFDGFNF